MKLAFDPVSLDDPAATPEESATTGWLYMEADGLPLAAGRACGESELGKGPLVSAYPLAEWLLWNWWRLRWESPPSPSTWDWTFAHSLSAVGSGYAWPNIEIASDGCWMHIRSLPSVDSSPSSMFQYAGAPRAVRLSAPAFETAVDGFIRSVLDRLDHTGIGESNLKVLAEEKKRDSQDAQRNMYRRFEALLGKDPGDGDPAEIDGRINDSHALGEQAALELAAADAPGRTAELRQQIDRAGFDSRPADAMHCALDDGIPAWESADAWRIGVALARKARRQADLNGGPVSDRRLAQMAGAEQRILREGERSARHISFEWRGDADGAARIALRSGWAVNRRFNLARLLVDRWLPGNAQQPLLPATRSYTYRQKAQRAFAAELLAPIDALRDYLGGDLSEARQEDAAEHFQVSSKVIHNALVNNGLLDQGRAFGATDRI